MAALAGAWRTSVSLDRSVPSSPSRDGSSLPRPYVPRPSTVNSVTRRASAHVAFGSSPPSRPRSRGGGEGGSSLPRPYVRGASTVNSVTGRPPHVAAGFRIDAGGGGGGPEPDRRAIARDQVLPTTPPPPPTLPTHESIHRLARRLTHPPRSLSSLTGTPKIPPRSTTSKHSSTRGRSTPTSTSHAPRRSNHARATQHPHNTRQAFTIRYVVARRGAVLSKHHERRLFSLRSPLPVPRHAARACQPPRLLAVPHGGLHGLAADGQEDGLLRALLFRPQEEGAVGQRAAREPQGGKGRERPRGEGRGTGPGAGWKR